MNEFRFKHTSTRAFKEKLTELSKRCGFFILLDSNTQARPQSSPYNKGLYLDTYDWIAALHPKRILSLQKPNGAFELLEKFHQGKWLFGYLSYSLKADSENVVDSKPNTQGFAALEFVEPGVIISAKGNEITVLYEDEFIADINAFIHEIENIAIQKDVRQNALVIKQNSTKEQYVAKVQSLQKHIQLGNIYEVNFCMNFYAENANLNPQETWEKLNAASPMPMAAFYKSNTNYLLCASPERFLKKEGSTIFSQPIKGTAPRGKTDAEDIANIEGLLADEKELAENVMIVDLVRNDVGRTAEVGTVKVDELFGVYPLPRVHQMISTVSSQLDQQYNFVDAIKKAFPMGSMTGAPKISAMQLIDEHEENARGLFSGAVGYITPTGDFDLNVVIRSIFYNEDSKALSYWAGSAITANADAGKEYEECMLKLEAIRSVLE